MAGISPASMTQKVPKKKVPKKTLKQDVTLRTIEGDGPPVTKLG